MWLTPPPPPHPCTEVSSACLVYALWPHRLTIANQTLGKYLTQTGPICFSLLETQNQNQETVESDLRWSHVSSGIVRWSYSAIWSRTHLSMKRKKSKAGVRDHTILVIVYLLSPELCQHYCILATGLGDTFVSFNKFSSFGWSWLLHIDTCNRKILTSLRK